MGRITFIVVRTALFTDGYSVEVTVFGNGGVMRRESYEKLSWREAQQVAEAGADHYRPGLELMVGGVQDSLF